MYKPIRAILTGGGTGGHIYPAIAIAHALKAQNPHNEILFIGAKGRMEMELVPAAGYPIVGLTIQGFQRNKIIPSLLLPIKIIKSLWQSRQVIQQFKPDIVIGTGGYVSAPAVYIATIMGIPTLIQEQNAYMGLTTQILFKRVDKICVAYEELKSFLPPYKTVLTGNPVRVNIANSSSKKGGAYAHFKLESHKKCLLVMGGSLGAHMINETIHNHIQQLIDNEIQIIWLTGDHYFKQLQARLPLHLRPQVHMYPFINDIELAYAAADVVISRAGALAIAELCVAQKATILVPSPHVTADHQTKNALPLVAQKAMLLVKEHDAPTQLISTTINLLHDTPAQQQLISNMQKWSKLTRTTGIISAITKLLHIC